MRPRLPIVVGALAAGLLVAGCGAKVAPRSAAEISAEAPYLDGAVAGSTPVAGTRITPSPTASASTTATITMVAVGDAYTTGTSMGGQGDKGWAALVGAALGWKVVPLGVEGSGYLTPGTGTTTFEQRIPAVVAAAPRIVIVWGARNDVGQRSSVLRAAAEATYADLKKALPSTTVVAIGPAWVDSSPPASYRNARDAEQAAAKAAGVLFVDPLEQDWFGGAGFMDADGVHPTDAGFAHAAGLLVADLKAAGLPEGTPSADTTTSSTTSATPTGPSAGTTTSASASSSG